MQPEINPHLLLKSTKPGISKPISVIYTLNKNVFVFNYVLCIYVCSCT